MKQFISFILFLFIISSSIVAQNFDREALFQPQKMGNGNILIEDFEDDSVGTLPKRWYNRDADFRVVASSKQEQSLYKYEIRQEEGNKYLHYNGMKVRHLTYPLKNKDGINIYDTSILSWKWRVHKLPKGANEDINGKNDTAASLYVVFEMGRIALFKKVPKSIRYTWSSTLEPGTNTSKLFGNQQILVLESGDNEMGKWKTFERNIVEDYRRLFGDDPPAKPLAILLMSDGDSMKDNAIADYDDIILKTKE
ncbi:DUF3047 domain-containing protein [Fodinibius halophilus]|uniref:DUF3047 domain-containing protein n=1 Tax=Fodinibius halophilus TaxID=1736908 RepID=A0A6M1TDW6_9BACT|nr:DUF3047 domain-containing protein [Fodinibius halophilus]NGP86880.1 DUF3047 domain-containing protein [Fodinibius halophilus]